MRQTLLSTQALQDMGIWNEHVRKKYRFFRKRGNILARGYNIGRTSYLGWVGNEDALVKELREPKEYARLVKRIDWELLHRRLGHPGKARFKQMIRKLGLSPGKEVIEELKTCETCVQAKSVKRQSHAEVPRASRPLKRVYMDFWGLYSKAKTPERYYLSLTDDCTRFSWIYLTKDREAATVRATLEKWLALVEREKGVKLLVIRTDNAKEFKALEPWALEKGITIEFTEPDTPQQNGVAERLNRYLLEMTRAILIDSDVPKEYWPYAIRMANYLRNRAVRVRGTKKTPFEMWFGHPPDMSKFRIPFSRVWFHRKTNDKMEPRAIEGVFVGYESSRNHYMVMIKQDQKIY
jgi:transposase InsO family protein